MSGIHNTSKQRLWIAMRQPEGSLLGENPLIPLLSGAGRFRLNVIRKEWNSMLAFLSGTIVGGIFGVMVMCLLQINRLHGSDTEVGG